MIEKNQCQPEPDRAYRFPIGAAGLCCIFLALLWGGLSLHLKSDRERTLQDAERENSRLARVFEEHVIRTIRAADLTLHHIESQYKRLGRKLDLVQFAKEHQVRQDPYTSLNIVDDKGFLALSSVPPHVRVDYSRNDNVVFHRQNNTPGLFISTPRLGARTKLLSVYLSRRINNPDGSLAGNSSLALDPFYFTKFYGDLDLGRGALVALVGRDGISRARIVDGEMSAGRDLGATSLFSRHLPTSASGFYRETSTRDATARLYSYRALTDYPLVVIVSAAEATVLAPYVARRDLYLALAAGISAAILLFGYFVVSQHQKQMAAASMLRESEERFKAFMDRVPGIAFIKDELGRYIYVNKTWEEIYARDWRGKTDAELWPRDNAVMFSESDRHALDAGEATEAFETVADKTGRAQHWWVMKFPVVDSHGKRLLGGIAMDITERNAAEQALLASETKLRQVTDAIPGAVYQYQLSADGSQSFISISDGIQNLIGHSAAAVVNDFSLLWNALLAKDQEACSSSILRSAQTMAPWEFEGRVRLSNGSLKWLRGHSVPVPRRPDGSIVWNGILTDITERKRNELERARLAAIVENSQDAIISRDLDLNIITWNPAAERLFGYTADEAVGKSVELLIPSDKQAEVAHRRSQLDQGVETSPFDTVRIGRDGKRIDVSVTQSPIRDASDTLVGVSLSLRDITERKRMEKSMHLTQFSIDRAVDGMFWILPSGKIIYVNDAACGILGYGREELIGKTVPDIDPSFPAETWPAHWQELKQKGSLTFESNHRTKDGRPLTTELTVNYIVYEGEEYNCAIMRDISARKQAEAERGRLAAIVENSGDAIISRGLDLQVLSWNAAAERMFGYRADEAIGRRIDFIIPDDLQAEVARTRASFMHGERVPSYDTVRLARGGQRLDVSITQSPILDGNGQVIAVSLMMRDISERKKAEAALRESEARYLRATAAGTVGVWELDYQTGIYQTDSNLKAMFGYGPDELDPDPYRWLALVHPEDQATAMAESAAVLAGRAEKYVCELRMIRKDGSIQWTDVRGEVERDKDGKALRLTGTTVDVTARKLAENALRESEQHLIAAQAIAHLGSWERDIQTGRSQWSDEIYRIFGYEPGSIEPNYDHWIARIHPDDRPRVQALRSAFKGNSTCDLEYRVIHPTGDVRHVHWRGELFRDANGHDLRVAGTVLDITDRKRAEEALRQAHDDLERRVEERTAELSWSNAMLRQKEEQLLLAQRAGQTGLWNRDLTTGADSTSAEWNELMGFPTDCDSVSYPELIDRVHPDDRARMQSKLSNIAEGNFEVEFRIIHPIKGERWIMARGRHGLSSEDGHLHMMGVIIDITERKANEEELRVLNEQLDQRVDQRTQELAESRAGLRELVAELTMTEERERRRLAVELHDTLAQSLAVVNMYLWRVRELLGDQANGAPFQEVLGNLDRTVNDSVIYTRSLISQLSPPVLYDLGLPAAFRWLGDQMARHGLRVEVDGSADSSAIDESDAVFLFQCARELLWNVVKHGATDCATLAYGRDGERWLSVVVADKGKGMELPSTPSDGGNHFGLFSIRERVALRGGKFEINSAPGAGTWVSIVIPTDRKEPVSVEPVQPTSLPGRIEPDVANAIKIVIVDDHKMVRQGLRRVLEEHKEFAIVGEAGDGAEAIALALELAPHVVLMDVNLPTMSGITATQGIIHSSPSTIVVGLSFGTDDYVLQAMQEAGAVTCIPKERAVEDVSQAIMSAVAERQGATH